MKKYPDKPPATILADLVACSPGQEGKWFATAKTAGLYDEAIRLANQSPCDPLTLIRAARDFAGKRPPFAVAAGLAALRWLVAGYGYEISSADVLAAYRYTRQAAETVGEWPATRDAMRAIVAAETGHERFVTRLLGRELGVNNPDK